mmetsp:Transcript_23150/g.59053  ORF Transcript_23150/g.59053 Transcript_23150/m.59053 type:complete len:344 (-) Transcript_23150:50-1081(-)
MCQSGCFHSLALFQVKAQGFWHPEIMSKEATSLSFPRAQGQRQPGSTMERLRQAQGSNSAPSVRHHDLLRCDREALREELARRAVGSPHLVQVVVLLPRLRLTPGDLVSLPARSVLGVLSLLHHHGAEAAGWCLEPRWDARKATAADDTRIAPDANGRLLVILGEPEAVGVVGDAAQVGQAAPKRGGAERHRGLRPQASRGGTVETTEHRQVHRPRLRIVRAPPLESLERTFGRVVTVLDHDAGQACQLRHLLDARQGPIARSALAEEQALQEGGRVARGLLHHPVRGGLPLLDREAAASGDGALNGPDLTRGRIEWSLDRTVPHHCGAEAGRLRHAVARARW